MKLRIISIVFLGLTALIFSTAAYAEEESVIITQEKISRIREQCVENQAALNRLHQTDAFLRNDRGNLYRTISSKLMVPLNQRLASNGLDGGELLAITSDFNKEYDEFYQAYIDYDNALSKVLRINCQNEPVAFYNALLEARKRRTELSAINQQLQKYISDYGKEFTVFKQEFDKEKE